MKPYPQYKDSGIEWIGRLPDHWVIKKIKYSIKINESTLTDKVSKNYLIKYIDIGNVYGDGLINPPEEMTFDDSPSRARRIVNKGDTIISTVRTYLKAIAFIESDEKNLIASTGFAVLNPAKGIYPKYLYYWASNQKVIDKISSLSTGVSYPAITPSELSSIFIWFPKSTDEQKSIAAFLDHKTQQIDLLIKKKERLIELLKEQRTAVINRAVTRGLNPHVKLKDSGIPWLGKIPEHWQTQKLKHIASIKFSNVDKHSLDTEKQVRLCNYLDVYYNDYITKDLNFMTATASSKEIANFELKVGDVIITKDSESWDDIAIPAYVSDQLNGILCGYHLAQIRVNDNIIIGEYLFRSFLSDAINHQFKVDAKGVTRFGLSKYGLDNAIFLVPPIEEQKTIAKYLDNKTKQIDIACKKQEKEIELIKEYRTALISAAVTGKIDVRGFKA